jgi:hypothetical protein
MGARVRRAHDDVKRNARAGADRRRLGRSARPHTRRCRRGRIDPAFRTRADAREEGQPMTSMATDSAFKEHRP